MIVIGNLFVPGRPKTKGSLSITPGRKCDCCERCRGYVGKPRAHDTKASSDWRALMAYQLRRRVEGDERFPLAGPVAVYALWVLPVAYPTQERSGDKDKLDRNLFDALTDAGVYADDVQVVDGRTAKIAGGTPGVGICVVAL